MNNKYDIDAIDINGPVPEEETKRQYYFMAKCKKEITDASGYQRFYCEEYNSFYYISDDLFNLENDVKEIVDKFFEINEKQN